MSRDAHGRNEFHGANGHEAHYGRDGHVREVRGRDSHGREVGIRHDARGGRSIEHGDHRVYVNRAGHGYVDRRFGYHGHEYAARSYYYHGRPYAVYYNHYGYHGVFLEGYAPVAYYSPAFYGWAYNPWVAPVPYAWGWAGAPWYGAYGFFFTPAPVYATASLWLTDYLIAQNLQAAYQENQDAAAAAAANAAAAAQGGPVVMTPEVKQAIAAEVQRQIALENAEAQTQAKTDVDPNSSGLPRMLAEASPTNPRIFVLGAALTVDDATGQECNLTEGDVLRLTGPTPADATSANLQVFASKPAECAKGAVVAVQLTDLQEMQNNMRANIDNGMKDLQAHKGGLPAPPASAAAPPTPAAYAPVAPPPDPNVASELAQEAKDADATENQVLAEAKQAEGGQGDTAAAAAPAAAAAAAPAELSVGQTPEQVTAALGQPKQIVKLGAKQIYVYPDMKVTFVNGKVSDIQ